jgi:hypothetical protein
MKRPDELNDRDRAAVFWDILEDFQGTHDPARWPVPQQTKEEVLRSLHDGFRVMHETWLQMTRERDERREHEGPGRAGPPGRR